MRFLYALAIAALCVAAWTNAARLPAGSADDEQSLRQADAAAFAAGKSAAPFDDSVLDPNFTWTDSFGLTRNRPEIVQALKSGKGFPLEAGSGSHALGLGTRTVHVDGQLGMVQENSGNLYALRVWVKHGNRWQLLVYQAVLSGAPASAEQGNGKCENPCNTVPFEPRSEEQRAVIQAYQAVERAVTAHNSAAWGSHIADEFFAVTSNSDRPLDKVARMAGLDNQKVAGIAPFPLASARMFEYGDAMVMTSLQQPEHGLPLHVTRVWFKRHGAWLEAYSYQTTIQAANSAR